MGRLTNNNSILRGDFIYSSNGAFKLTFQTDGNLVLRHEDIYPGPHAALWASGTDGSGATALVLDEGNLLLVDNSTGPTVVEYWSTRTRGNKEAYFEVQDDGNLVIYQPRSPIWATNTVRPVTRGPIVPGQHVLSSRGFLPVGRELVSPRGAFRLSVQTDGNLVLYAGSEVLWKTDTDGKAVDGLSMQNDGNLVLIGRGLPVWAAGTNNHRNAYLAVQDDGNVVIYADRAIWASR